MPSRPDLERLVVWCDPSATESPSQLLRPELGAALIVHRMTPSGDVDGLAAAWKGRIGMSAPSSISEFPAERVRFGGTLPGLRNPAKTATVVLATDAGSLTVTLSGDVLAPDWSTRFDAAHAADTAGVIRVDWTLPGHLFELFLWPDLGIGVDVGPP
ncbi:hypothetical protein ACQPZX_23670 [Actinoplanes sp. CA-142083]|uniref:hypothetical protein n=1 Tax=Actinoplanes sp. CA-142083 TaxID=3239903 RepID=UPI003D8FEBEA